MVAMNEPDRRARRGFLRRPANADVCSILEGQVGVEDQYGARKLVSAGQAFIVPKGFQG